MAEGVKKQTLLISSAKQGSTARIRRAWLLWIHYKKIAKDGTQLELAKGRFVTVIRGHGSAAKTHIQIFAQI